MTTQTATTETPQRKPSDLIEAVRGTPLTSADYAELILAIKQSIPRLDPPDKSLHTRLTWARRVSPTFVHSVATGLDGSPIWQQSAEADPEEMRQHLTRAEELRPIAEQSDALNALLQFNMRYHHFAAVDKARTAYNVGRHLGGKEGKVITPNLKIAKVSAPKTRHKTTKATFLAEDTVPPPATE